MYVDVPTNVSAMEFINSPDTPKSHILISPRELHNIFDGLMSERTKGVCVNNKSCCTIEVMKHHV